MCKLPWTVIVIASCSQNHITTSDLALLLVVVVIVVGGHSISQVLPHCSLKCTTHFGCTEQDRQDRAMRYVGLVTITICPSAVTFIGSCLYSPAVRRFSSTPTLLLCPPRGNVDGNFMLPLEEVAYAGTVLERMGAFCIYAGVIN